MPTQTPLTDQINALTTYANTITGASDTCLSDAVATLADGYGGGGSDVLDSIAMRTITEVTINATEIKHDRMFYLCSQLVSVNLPNVTNLAGGLIFTDCTALTSVYCPKLRNMGASEFQGCTSLRVMVLPSFIQYGNNGNFQGCTALEVIDYGSKSSPLASNRNFFSQNEHKNNSSLTKIILRAENQILRMGNLNNFDGTPFASGGTGGEIYIPKVLYDHLGDGTALDYKSATNWSTYDGYGTITWKQIEGSIYETQYADGTPIE